MRLFLPTVEQWTAHLERGEEVWLREGGWRCEAGSLPPDELIREMVVHEEGWLLPRVMVAGGVLVGSVAFKGAPDEEGCVEIGYGVAPRFQRRGYATRAVGQVLREAAVTGRMRSLCAHVLPENRASVRVLERNGFALAGEVMTEEDGVVHRYCREVAAPRPDEPVSLAPAPGRESG